MHNTYTTCASCGGIQLILAVGSFHTDPFPTMVRGDMVHRERGSNISLWSTSCTTFRPQPPAHNSPRHQHREPKKFEGEDEGTTRARGPT
jgi:hypothetical protein